MKLNESFRRGCVLLAAALLCGTLTACEETEQGTAISVTPDTAVLTGSGDSIVFTATPAVDGLVTNGVDSLFLPLEWEVSNPDIGKIQRSGGYSAVYESNGRVGQNFITVRDQAGSEGVALVEQRRASSSGSSTNSP
jgi:hypothetical protein